jgi:hypothetical protein
MKSKKLYLHSLCLLLAYTSAAWGQACGATSWVAQNEQFSMGFNEDPDTDGSYEFTLDINGVATATHGASACLRPVDRLAARQLTRCPMGRCSTFRMCPAAKRSQALIHFRPSPFKSSRTEAKCVGGRSDPSRWG